MRLRTTDNATLFRRARWWLLNHFSRPPDPLGGLDSPGGGGGDNESSASVSGIYADYVENEVWWHEFDYRQTTTVRGLELAQPPSGLNCARQMKLLEKVQVFGTISLVSFECAIDTDNVFQFSSL